MIRKLELIRHAELFQARRFDSMKIDQELGVFSLVESVEKFTKLNGARLDVLTKLYSFGWLHDGGRSKFFSKGLEKGR